MGEEVEVTCPWCFEPVTLWVDRDTMGKYVEDCEVCCRPWQVYVQWDDDTDRAWVDIERADG